MDEKKKKYFLYYSVHFYNIDFSFYILKYS